MRLTHLLRALPLLAAASLAQAHHLWIETTGEATTLRYGEFGDNLRETSPGLLDRFVKPEARVISGESPRPLQVTKSTQGFALSGGARAGESVVAEDTRFPLAQVTWEGKKVTSWFYPSTRQVADLSAQKPTLPLDITPTGQPGEFQLSYRGAPLPKVKVQAVVASGWGREVHSDAQGRVQFPLPWQGTYVIEASYIERQGGERDGQRYDGIYYTTTLSFVQPQGLTPLPAGPAATPN